MKTELTRSILLGSCVLVMTAVSASASELSDAEVNLSTQNRYMYISYQSTSTYSLRYESDQEYTTATEGNGYIDHSNNGNPYYSILTSSADVDRVKETVSATTTYVPGDRNANYSDFRTTASLDFQIEFSGPDGYVPVKVEGTGITTATNGRSEASLTIYGSDVIPIASYSAVSDTNNDTFGAPSNFDTNNALLYFQANMLYDITLTASATGSSYAYVDPTFSIFLPNANDYTFLQSAGVGPAAVSAVPLPASAPMFGAAVLALGLVGYGVKRKVAPATA